MWKCSLTSTSIWICVFHKVFIDTEEPIFPTEGIYSSGDYKALMNLVWRRNWIWFANSFCAQITHTEEMPESMMMKNAVISVFFLRFLQHGKYFKKHVPEKKKVFIRAKPQFFLFGPSQAISAQSDKWPVRKVLNRVCTSVNEKLRIFKSQLWPNYLLEIAAAVEMRPSENIFSRETEACILPNSLFFDCFTTSLLCSASTVNRLKNFFLFCISLIPADEAVSREVCVQLGSDRDVDQHKHGADQPQVSHL